MWDVIGYIPKFGSIATSARSNIGVNMKSTEPLPLGAAKEYPDERTLVSLDLKDLITDQEKQKDGENAKPKDLATRLWERIPQKVKDGVVYAIKAAKWINDQTAQNEIIDLIATGLDLIKNAGALELSAKPSWKVEGVQAGLLLRYRFGNRPVGGSMPLYFERAGQEKTFEVWVPGFVQDGEKLYVYLDELEYKFKLFQNMTAKITLSSVVNASLGEVDKYVAMPQAIKTFSESESAQKKFEIPLKKATGRVVDMFVTPGYQAIKMGCASPRDKLRATVQVSDRSGRVIKEESEKDLKYIHTIFVTGLQPNTDYSVQIKFTDEQGQVFSYADSFSVKTEAKLKSEPDAKSRFNDVELSNPRVTAGVDSITATWTTNKKTTTSVLVSPLSTMDLYTAAHKHANGQVSMGNVSSVNSPFEMTTNHSITVTRLAPETTYQVVLRSYIYDRENINGQFLGQVGYRTSVTTSAPPLPPSVQIKLAAAGQLANLPVTISRGGLSTVAYTDSNGITPPTVVDAGQSYTASVRNLNCFQDAQVSFSVPAGASGPQPQVTLNLAPRPAPNGRVTNSAGQPVVARIKRLDNGASITVSGDGSFAIAGLAPNSSVNLQVTHPDYYPVTVTVPADECGRAVAPGIVLQPSKATLKVTVTDSKDQRLSGARVLMREPNQTSGGNLLGQTDGQGQLTWIGVVGSEPVMYTKTLVVEPPAGRILEPGTSNVVLSGGATVELQPVLLPGSPRIKSLSVEPGTIDNALKVSAVTDASAQLIISLTGPGAPQPITTALGADHLAEWPNLTPGNYQLEIKLRDQRNRQENILARQVTILAPVPKILSQNLQVNMQQKSLQATATTDAPAQVRIRATPTSGGFSRDGALSASGTSHSVSLEGLRGGTYKIYLVVRSADGRERVVFIRDVNFGQQTGRAI